MKILLVSTLKRDVTPTETASRSRVIYELGKKLSEKGHEVSLLGTAASSIPGVTTIPVTEKSWVNLPPVENPFFREIATMVQLAKKIVEIQHDFDIIHNHMYPEFFTPLVESEITIPFITTVHVQATDYIDKTLSLFKKSVFVSISEAHRSKFKDAQIHSVIYNGVDTNLYTFRKEKDDYLLWIGRLSKARNADGSYMDPKGARHAIQLAEETGSRLIMSGNVEDSAFFETDIKPHLNNLIQWVGPVSAEQPLPKEQVVALMQKAKAFLMPINWDEPFGLVMTEAMACGTPVIGFSRGSVPELVADGQTGFVVPPEQGIDGLKNVLTKLDSLSPEACRKRVEELFSLDKMTGAYEQLYTQLYEDYRIHRS